MRRPHWAYAALAALVLAGAVVAAVAASGPGASRHHPSAHSPGTSTPPSRHPSTTTTGAAASGGPGGAARPHVMVIVMENHGYGEIIGNPTAPYINGLAARYGLATASYATTHPSLPNYLTLVSGSAQGIASDCTTCTANAPQLVDQLQAAGIGWAAYMESAPTPCYTGTAPPFDRHHDPFVYAPHIVTDRAACDRVVPFGALVPALRANDAPPFIWITPNVEDDMHTGSVRQGDNWLRTTIGEVQSSAWYRAGGTVIVTWDEGTTTAGCCGGGAAGGQVATLVISAATPRGARMAVPVDGAGILRTIESLYHLGYLGGAADPRSGTLLPLLGSRPLGA